MSHDVLKALAMGSTLVVLGTVITMAWMTKDATPKLGYTVGQCVVLKSDYEPWEVPQVWYIEMVAKRSYLVRRTPANVNKTSEGTTITFPDGALWYQRVDCPAKS